MIKSPTGRLCKMDRMTSRHPFQTVLFYNAVEKGWHDKNPILLHTCRQCPIVK